MSERLGLAAETCTRELAQEMAAIPALAEAFKKSALVWYDNLERGIELYVREEVDEGDPAPTAREMLAWLATQYKLRPLMWPYLQHSDAKFPFDPDALARACIEEAKA